MPARHVVVVRRVRVIKVKLRGKQRANGADGISDVEGKVARVAMSELGNERVSMEPRGRERHRWAKPRGQNGREHMSQRGQRASFNISELSPYLFAPT